MQKAVSILRAVREAVHSLSESSCLYVQSGMNGHAAGGQHAAAAYPPAQSSGSPSQAQTYMVRR